MTFTVLIRFVEPDGVIREADIVEGRTLMEGALSFGVAGIDGDCGGNLSCATCHVHLDPVLTALAGAPSSEEDDLLECVSHRDPTSRLACQIVVSAAMDGGTVRVPPS